MGVGGAALSCSIWHEEGLAAVSFGSDSAIIEAIPRVRN